MDLADTCDLNNRILTGFREATSLRSTFNVKRKNPQRSYLSKLLGRVIAVHIIEILHIYLNLAIRVFLPLLPHDICASSYSQPTHPNDPTINHKS
jgi:hypothetical protein